MKAQSDADGTKKGRKGAGRTRRRTALKRGETVEPPKAGQVIYIGHIPHGFYEDQMREYFSQFGKVTRIRLSRNKKTGKSKHYAFVEFGNAEVAEIAAQTMNGYMMFTQRLDTHIMKEEDLHPELFKGANQKFKALPRQRLERERLALPKSAEQAKKNLDRLQGRDEKRRRKLEEAGIEYEFEGFVPAAAKRAKKDSAENKTALAGMEENAQSRKGVFGSKAKAKVDTAQEVDTNEMPTQKVAPSKASARADNTSEMPGNVTYTGKKGVNTPRGTVLKTPARKKAEAVLAESNSTPKASRAITQQNDFQTPEARIIAKRSPKTRAAKAARAAAESTPAGKVTVDSPATTTIETPATRKAVKTPAAKRSTRTPATKTAVETPAAKRSTRTPAAKRPTIEAPPKVGAQTPSKKARTASATKAVSGRKPSTSPFARRVTRSQAK